MNIFGWRRADRMHMRLAGEGGGVGWGVCERLESGDGVAAEWLGGLKEKCWNIEWRLILLQDS